MGSADTRDKERDDTLKTPDLFDTAKFLRSTYLATQFVAKGTGFEGRGKLTLRGVTPRRADHLHLRCRARRPASRSRR